SWLPSIPEPCPGPPAPRDPVPQPCMRSLSSPGAPNPITPLPENPNTPSPWHPSIQAPPHHETPVACHPKAPTACHPITLAPKCPGTLSPQHPGMPTSHHPDNPAPCTLTPCTRVALPPVTGPWPRSQDSTQQLFEPMAALSSHTAPRSKKSRG
uniref:Uncharacterized protein n=1 Tax=Anser brachyrhynchus TaxID=132585 RepID=A0A8B9B9C8_9AVES